MTASGGDVLHGRSLSRCAAAHEVASASAECGGFYTVGRHFSILE